MKVDLQWGKRINNATFNVPGKDIKSAVSYLNSREEWGRFDGNIEYKYSENANKIIYKVRIIPSYVITMPNWPAYRNQTQKIKDSWDNMYKALKKHEEEHKVIFQQGLNKLLQDTQSLSKPTLSDFESLFHKSVQAIKKKQDDYDTETENGAARGVEIIIE